MFGIESAVLMQGLRSKRPLVHHITNYVTVNDCANMAICTGSAPVMADAEEEMSDMVSIADALVLNIGTLNERLVKSMILAGEAANRKGIPVVLDPVGAGATPYRTSAVHRIMDKVKVDILKGNAGEIATLAGSKAKVVGVDSHGVEGDPARICREYSSQIGCTVVMTGPQDIISDGTRTLFVNNGHEMMESVSGTGCMASTVVASFAAVCDDTVLASASALAMLGVAGENAARSCKGPMSFKAALFDSMSSMSASDLEERTRIRDSP